MSRVVDGCVTEIWCVQVEACGNQSRRPNSQPFTLYTGICAGIEVVRLTTGIVIGQIWYPSDLYVSVSVED